MECGIFSHKTPVPNGTVRYVVHDDTATLHIFAHIVEIFKVIYIWYHTSLERREFFKLEFDWALHPESGVTFQRVVATWDLPLS